MSIWGRWSAVTKMPLLGQFGFQDPPKGTKRKASIEEQHSSSSKSNTRPSERPSRVGTDSDTRVESKPVREQVGRPDFACICTVNVGTGIDAATVTVHQHAVRKFSTFFNSILSGRWAAASSRPIDLSQFQRPHFEAWLEACYSGEVLRAPGQATAEDVHLWYVELYLMGTYLGDFDFCDMIAEELIALSSGDETPTPELCHHVWNQTAPESKLRTLFLDWLVWCADAQYLQSGTQNYPIEMRDAALAEAMRCRGVSGRRRSVGREFLASRKWKYYMKESKDEMDEVD